MNKRIKRFMLIDGNALIHRGFHAIAPLSTKQGEQTNAVYGFTMILLRAIKELKPTHIACTFDLAAPTFRHAEYSDYKATRVKAAQELYDQIPRVKEVVKALNIPIYEKEGFEADDMLGSLTSMICKQQSGSEVLIVTGDLDTLQLVNDCVKIYTLKRGLTDIAVYDEQAVRGRYGLNPSQMIDYKALRGDPSDNIKGVSGIGEKGAAQLINDFGSLKALYEAIEKNDPKVDQVIKPRIKSLLIEQKNNAEQSYRLSTIVQDVPLPGPVPEYSFAKINLQEVTNLFKELEFRTLLDKLPKNYTPNNAETDNAEPLNDKAQQIIENDFKQEYVLVQAQDQIADIVKMIRATKEVVLDTETNSLNPIDAKLVGLSICIKEGLAWYIPASLVVISTELISLLEDQKIKKIGHNIKYDLLVLQNENINLKGIFFDTMIASYLLDSAKRQHNLEALAFSHLGYQMQPITDLIGVGKKQITMDQVPVEKVSWYACEDADVTFRLYKLFASDLQGTKLSSIFSEIEMPLTSVLAGMERAGILLDAEFLNSVSAKAEHDIDRLTEEIYSLAGQEFNLNSPKQLKEILFDKLGLFPVGNKKTKTGISTAAGELEKMFDQHPIIPLMMQYRELAKVQSTYLQALPLLVNSKTGRIHTSFNQTIAATGRLSSTEPNLQNIPARGTGYGSEVRKAFVAAPGNCFLSLDYSQIELRIVAHLAQDKTMIKVFNDGQDIHTSTAKALFGVDEQGITADMRRDAKAVNFGILYGLSSFGLSENLGTISRIEAKNFIDTYFSTYPGVKKYIESVKQAVNKDGLVVNQIGRIRKFPEIKSSQFFIRAAAERGAMNFPIQSLQADIIKIAMNNIYNDILQPANSDIKMILQVHDELVFEVKEGSLESWAKKIKPIMEDALPLSVPVVVDAKSGSNWGELKPLWPK